MYIIKKDTCELALSESYHRGYGRGDIIIAKVWESS